MTTIAEKHPDFKTFERSFFEMMCRIACEEMRQYLEWRDKSIMAERDSKQYRQVGIRETTIKTVMGEVRFKRRYYRGLDGSYVFLLDEEIGLSDNYGLVSENLAEQIVAECTEKSFRKAAAGICENTGQGISSMGAWNILQQYGMAIEQQETRLHELEESGSVGHLGNISTPVVCEEYDDVWISMQRKKRLKKGQPVPDDRKRIGKKPMHAGIAYTGWSETVAERFSLVDKIAYASFGKAKDFAHTFEVLLQNRFDIDGVQQRITNGDGESWIRTASEEKDTILQLDPFHRSQAVVRYVSDKDDRQLIFDAIGEKDVEQVLSVISALRTTATEEKEIKKLDKLHGYFNSNKDSFLTWQERGLELPNAPDGIVYRNMGVMESSNCDLLTQRMKHRKGSWSEQGANHMAKILCIRKTIGLETIFGELPQAEPAEAYAEPLSSSKAPAHDGKGYGAQWLYAQMPFEGAMKTNGREAIRNMLRLKPISQLALR